MKDKRTNTPLYLHVLQYNLAAVQAHLALSTGDLNQWNYYKETPLCLAVSNGYVDISLTLLSYNCDVNKPNYKHQSPLYIACQKGFYNLCVLLIQHGALVTNPRESGMDSPLHIAIRCGYLDIVTLLLQNNACVNHLGKQYDTPLLLSITMKHEEISHLLLTYNVDVNVGNDNNWTPLHAALHGDSLSLASLLINRNCNVNCSNKNHQLTPLHVAGMKGIASIATLLIQRGALVNSLDSEQCLPLHYAAMNGHTALCLLLIYHGSNVYQQNQDNKTSLYCAILNPQEHGYYECAARMAIAAVIVHARHKTSVSTIHRGDGGSSHGTFLERLRYELENPIHSLLPHSISIIITHALPFLHVANCLYITPSSLPFSTFQRCPAAFQAMINAWLLTVCSERWILNDVNEQQLQQPSVATLPVELVETVVMKIAQLYLLLM